MFSGSCCLKKTPGRPKSVFFFTKKLNMSYIFRRPIRGLISRPDKSIFQYNGQTNNISWPTIQIHGND